MPKRAKAAVPPPAAKPAAKSSPRGGSVGRKAAKAAMREVRAGVGLRESVAVSAAAMGVKPGIGAGNVPSKRCRAQMARERAQQEVGADGAKRRRDGGDGDGDDGEAT
jgi:hypothetical protein